MSNYQLYYAPDNASLIVRILLEELGVNYAAILVDRSINQHHSDDYRALNPNGLIPVCVIDGQNIFETAAILQILCEKHQQFFPGQNSKKRANHLKWLYFISNNIHADLRQLFYPEQYIGAHTDSSLHRHITVRRLHNNFSYLDAEYSHNNGLYFDGDSPCIIDFYCALALRWSQIYPLSHPKQINPYDYPHLFNMITVLEKRAKVRRACLVEGLPEPFFSQADYPKPPEGSAL